jgi:bifunctional enzyme CysN/CysC
MEMLDRRDANTGDLPVASKDLLRFLTCGSVDDGKSTLIGRLLYDTKLILEDHMTTLESDSRKFGTTGDEVDLALLLDGLEAEREQGITIDVAYRFFATGRRSFIVADTPGHEQYTRNMATGASNTDLAVLVLDARAGLRTQTQRHSVICSLLGIRHIVLAVNKMDLVGYDKDVFDRIVKDYAAFAASLPFTSVVPVPISARFGDNVTARSPNTSWYEGPTLLEHLEMVDIESDVMAKPFRLAVQRVNRPSADFRGFAGRIASGRVHAGDQIVVARGGAASTVSRIMGLDGVVEEAGAGDIVTLELSENIDVARGDLLGDLRERPVVADQFAAHIIWMAEEPLLPGRSYLMRIGTAWTLASVSAIKYQIDVADMTHLAAPTLSLNDIGVCNLSTSVPVAFDPYEENRDTGCFILVDRETDHTVGAGMISFALRRATNIHREPLAADKALRARMKHQSPCILWFTGLSGSGKSTIARALEDRLTGAGYHTYMLDGDNLRHGINRDLGFTDVDRVENIRRAGEVAKLFVDSGLIVLCALISPFRAERQMVRDLVERDEFMEIFVETPLEECMRRDPKGLYSKAMAGTLKNFTGIDSPYEVPERPDLMLHTLEASPEALAEIVLLRLRDTGHLS